MGDIATALVHDPPSMDPEPPLRLPPLEKRVAFEAVGQRLFRLDSSPIRLGRFIVLDTLGRGGMGTVFKAFDESLDRSIAIKLLHSGTSERHAQRLRREAQALAKLSHPNVVHVYEVDEADGRWFIAMELVTGPTLRQWYAEDHGWRECVELHIQVGAGLAAAHAVGLVHRDFKPDNCIIDEQGRPRVLDFGLARDSSEVVSTDDLTSSAPADGSLTRTGAVLGTLGYMPLEQLDGTPADARSDQFSFCVSLWEALYAERPFVGSSAAELAVALSDGTVQPGPRGSSVPASVRRTLLRGLSADPNDRFVSMEALLAELRRHVTPRARRWMTLGLLGGTVAAAVGLASYAEVGFRCEGADEQLHGVWDPARRQEVEAAVLATGLPYAPDTWQRVRAQLDDYASAWAAKHTQVCEATSVRQEQSSEVMDLRMECLRQRRGALQELVSVLAEANATRVENAVRLVASVPRLSRCDDVEALRAELPPPEDPDVAAQVQEQRQRLRRARSLQIAGEFEEGLELAEQVVGRAQALEHPPLLAEALLRRGLLYSQTSRYAESEEDLEQAYTMAMEHGHDAVAVAAASRLIRVVGEWQVRPEEGLWWSKTALALARSPRTEPEQEATALNGIGYVLQGQGKWSDALGRHRQALKIMEALEPESLGVSTSLSGLGIALSHEHDIEAAFEHHQRALALVEDLLGPEHPSVATELHNLGIALAQQGREGDAMPYFERALDIRERALGPVHLDVAASVYVIGNVLADRGDFTQAQAYFQRSVSVLEQAMGADHRRLAHPLDGLGRVLEAQGKWNDALEHHRRALAIVERALGATHPDLAFSLSSIARVLKAQRKLEEALPYYRRALTIRENGLAPGHPLVAVLLSNIAGALFDMGQWDDAAEHYRRATTMLEQAHGPEHPQLAYPVSGLAHIALERGELDLARSLAERAIVLCERSELYPDTLASGRFVLARVLWEDPERRVQARELARQARDAFHELGDGKADEIAEIDAWLAER